MNNQIIQHRVDVAKCFSLIFPSSFNGMISISLFHILDIIITLRIEKSNNMSALRGF